MNVRPLVIYHAPCQDGFTAAWVVWNALKGEVDLFPGVYQRSPPDVTDRYVILVDFSYKSYVVAEMSKTARQIMILDHHKSAIEDLQANGAQGTGLLHPDKVSWVLDAGRSGAGIAWDYFNPGKDRPALIAHVEDRDMWKFELEGTREITARLFAEEYDLNNWTDFVRRMDDEVFRADWINEGAAILKKQAKDVKELVTVCKRSMMIGDHVVPVASIPYTLTSDAGHLMAEGVPFAACYWDTRTGRVFSLRSAEGGVDVSKIAVSYGGGGHRNAAGFEVPFADLVRLGLL